MDVLSVLGLADNLKLALSTLVQMWSWEKQTCMVALTLQNKKMRLHKPVDDVTVALPVFDILGQHFEIVCSPGSSLAACYKANNDCNN